MKELIYGMVMFLITVFALALLMTVCARGQRQQELNMSVNSAMEYALRRNMQRDGRQRLSDQQMADDFTEDLLLLCEHRSAWHIQIICSDTSRGILSVSVREYFPMLNGKKGKISCTRTAVWDEGRKKI